MFEEAMFEKASRLKLRFDSPRGRLTAEDLWDLPLIGGDACLDDIAKVLHRELEDDSQESFVILTNEPNVELQLKFGLVKHVIDVRLQEQKVAENVEAMRQKKQQLLAIIVEKESENLKGKGIDELRELLETL
jgi:hypothetical protein